MVQVRQHTKTKKDDEANPRETFRRQGRGFRYDTKDAEYLNEVAAEAREETRRTKIINSCLTPSERKTLGASLRLLFSRCAGACETVINLVPRGDG
jgi:hypothetical protein